MPKFLASIFIAISTFFSVLAKSSVQMRTNVSPTMSPAIVATPTVSIVPNPIMVTPRPTPRATPISSPTPHPTPNPAVQDRISQVDKQIDDLKKQGQAYLDLMNEDVKCGSGCTSMFYANSSTVQSIMGQIKQLKNEKADLQLQLGAI